MQSWIGSHFSILTNKNIKHVYLNCLFHNLFFISFHLCHKSLLSILQLISCRLLFNLDVRTLFVMSLSKKKGHVLMVSNSWNDTGAFWRCVKQNLKSQSIAWSWCKTILKSGRVCGSLWLWWWRRALLFLLPWELAWQSGWAAQSIQFCLHPSFAYLCPKVEWKTVK